MKQQEIPYGFCQCGCGQETPLATRNRANRGWIKGQPRPFIKGHQKPKYATLEDYFWTYCTPTEPNECWEWLGAKTEGGYGVMNYRGKIYYAHRASWEIANGKPLPRGKFACHQCDNRCCVNPNHIWPGGLQANTDDMVSKGRHAHGERSGASKLTAAQVTEMIQMAQTNITYSDIADHFGITRAHVSSILTGSRWAHITKAQPIRRNRVLGSEEVRKIRHVAATTSLSIRKIAQQFGTHHSVISKVIKGESYKHIT